MSVETINTLVVGGGQAGLAMSEHLSHYGIPHVVVERERIAERWRSARWDSLVANGPAWHDCFPSMTFENFDGDGFPSKDRVTEYFEEFAKRIDAPIRTGVEVTKAYKIEGSAGYRVETSAGEIQAEHIVAATGPFQIPVIPPLVPQTADVTQLHSHDYHNPQQLPDGAVLVVGSGSSGAQIADELLRSGRNVYLSVGPHERPPRSYRERDFVWWLGVLGKWDLATVDPETAHVTIAVSGAYGGRTVDFREFASRGMTLLGMTGQYDNGVLQFEADLCDNLKHGDVSLMNMLDEADRYVEANGIDLPEEPEARKMLADPACVSNPVLELDLAEAGVNSIIWATGYVQDFSWLQVDAFDVDGNPSHQRGVSKQAGIYFLGLPWLSRRGSSFIWGVWHDAKYLADQINIHCQYLNYTGKG